MDYTLFDGCSELLNAYFRLPSFKLNFVDEQFLLELHLPIHYDIIYLSLGLTHNAVHISDNHICLSSALSLSLWAGQ
jgi:hypothetical protein